MGLWAHRDGVEGNPRWGRGQPEMGSWAHRDGVDAKPTWAVFENHLVKASLHPHPVPLPQAGEGNRVGHCTA